MSLGRGAVQARVAPKRTTAAWRISSRRSWAVWRVAMAVLMAA